MRLQQSHLNVTKTIPYSNSIQNFLKQTKNDDEVKEFKNVTLGGILSDINYAWLSNGPRLEVLSTKNGSKVAAWTFGEVIKDYYTRITCVVDLPISRSPVLIVGLQSAGTRGMICIFDVRTSRILRAIQISKPVTSIHVIDSSSETNFPGALRAFDGILAVGTEQGHIYLIDLCRQLCDDAVNTITHYKNHIRDEITACDLIHIELSEIPNLEKHKENALKTGDHLCIQLNEGCTETDFLLRGPKNEVRLRANIVEVKISALHYCHSLGSLLVGYNFGAFQIYDLLGVKLDYSSPAYEDCIPVSHFAFQEPCDDPRAFCYIWVMYSNIESDVAGFPLAVMYSLSYETKEFLEGYGNLYQDLTNCSIRFQTELKSLPTSNLRPVGASCVSLMSYTRGVQKSTTSESLEDRLSLCNVVWTVFDTNQSETFMCLFDLNQWYKEQMPGAPNGNDTSYMIFATISPQESLLDLKIDSKTINQFTSAQRLEEHYYPSALSFNLISLQANSLTHFESVGVQKNLLSLIKSGGPLTLLRPSEIYQQCISLGLSPINCETPITGNSPKVQREFILSVALENQLISWLCQCAQEWSNGSQSITGCTLEFLIDWAWSRTNSLKNTVNELCGSLFDYSGQRLDANASIILNDCARQLKHLSNLYEFILNRCPYMERSEIESQYNKLKMISTYIEVLQWLLNVGLLPECPIFMYPRVDDERISAPYPVDSLIRYYNNRRRELFELQGLPQNKENQSCDLLFIDNLIDIECGGDVLHSDWTNDSGSGLYPPPSLQALLRTYLIENVDIVYKHCIFIYVFLDLAMTLDQSRYAPIITHLIKFPAVFKLSPSIIKITQAFWQLDHGDFSTAMAQLLDPLISNEILQPWHHRIAVKALLAQGQHQHALLYHQVRNPPMTKVQDLIITITVLIVNDLLKEAFHFQRQNRSECNEKEIISHFIEVCDKANKLFQVIQLPLNEIEELELIKYLQEHRREDTDNYLVQYFLQRSRFAEAFESNDKINGRGLEKQGLVGKFEMNSRNSLINRYKSTLPSVTQELLTYLQKPSFESSNCRIFERPDPMSVYVHKSQDKLKYKSSLINASLHKAKEIWGDFNKKSFSLPFLSTPKTVTVKSQNSTPVIVPTIIETILVHDDVEEGPTPTKRQKLSPRKSIGSNKSSNQLLSLTPIVKRKSIHSRRESSSILDQYPGSPQSILKVRKLVTKNQSPADRVDRGNSTTPEVLDEDDSDSDPRPFNDLTKETAHNSLIDLSDYNITPSTKKQLKTSVRFEEKQRSVTLSSEGSERSEMEEMEIDQVETPKIPKQPAPVSEQKMSARKRKLNDSVQSRRSYKDNSLNNTSAVLEAIDKELETPKEVKTNFPKVTGRKSLTRKVLEHNTIRALSSPRTRSFNKSNTGIEISHTETTTNYVKETYANKIEKSSNKDVFEVKNSFKTEIDPNTSSLVTKHTHNESHTRSSSRLVEFDDSASDISSIDPILTGGSDIDESFLIKYVKTAPNMNLSQTLSETDQDDITEDIMQEENEDIVEIQSLNEKENVSNETESFVSIENSEVKSNENVVIVESSQPFEITDDLTDEDVSFTIHSTMNAEIDPNKNENLLEIKDIEPENYLEPNFEEEVRNVLGEDSEVDEQFLTKYTENPINEDVHNGGSSESSQNRENAEDDEEVRKINEEKLSDQEEEESDGYEESGSERAENIEKIEVSEDSSSSSETSNSEKVSDQEEEESEVELEQNDVIEIDSSSPEPEEEEMHLVIDENEHDTTLDSSSIDAFEKNITSSNITPNITGYESNLSDPNLNVLEKNISESNFEHTNSYVELAPMEIPYHQHASTENHKITIVETQEACEILIQSQLEDVEDLAPSTSKIQPEEPTDIFIEPKNSNEEDQIQTKKENHFKEEESIPVRVTRSRKTSEMESEPLPSLLEEEISNASSKKEENDLPKNFERAKSPSRRGRKRSVSIEDSKEAQVEEKTEKGKTPSRRGRRPSVTKETEIAALPIVREQEEQSGRVTPSRRGRKPSVQEDGPNETNLEAKSQENTKEIFQEEVPVRRTRSTSVEVEVNHEFKPRRGRKPSVSKESEESIPIQVPVRRGRKPSQDITEEAPTPKRRGRRPSVEVEDKPEPSTPSRRTRRTSLQPEPILEEEISTPSRRITRRTSIQLEETEGTPSRRTSTQSEDVPVTPSRRGRKPSTDVKTPTRKTRASSVISDGNVSPAKSTTETISDKIDEYAATHRLTRRQKVMMKEKGPPTGNIDPLTLLDKETFSGEPDLDEYRHDKSPASSICTESSVGTRSSVRIQSKRTTPDRSYTESPSLPSTPRRGKRLSLKLEEPILEVPEVFDDEPSTSSGKTKRKSLVKVVASPAKRTRRGSQDSNASEVGSVKSEVVLKLHRLDNDEIEQLRHQSLSPTTLKTDSPSSQKVRKGLSVLAKTELSKISEENTSTEIENDKAEKSTIPKKRGRPKKT